MQVKTVQHGRGERGARSAVTGELVCGPETLPEEELAKQPRRHVARSCSRTRSTTPYYRERSPDFSKITVPLLSAANWGGQGLHLRGNFEGFMRAASHAEVAGGARRLALGAVLHRLRRRPAEALLRPLPQGRGQRLGPAAARCSCKVRHPGERFVDAPRERVAARAHAVDAASTSTRATCALGDHAAGAGAGPSSYDAHGRRRHLPDARRSSRRRRSPARRRCKLFVSSAHRGRRPLRWCCACSIRTGKEVVFQGALDPHTPVGAGLAARLAPQARPGAEPALPPVPHARRSCSRSRRASRYELDVEIWPTCIVVPRRLPHRR